ncbi:hypothetical protein SAMN05660199_03194 [Klenkia soli]|uniref:Serine protease inhibitor n=1 Tax=Klenkia soli TaxID=1052260 RepID=A0A1H0Q2Y3_9ACTN|nr:hypothetical protein [Klenkia soli]SDP11753.1 hypothetical protein SAMN05660199_03194 [Klenkia soli]
MTTPFSGPLHETTALPDVVGRYADRFHRGVEGDHWIASPLGAWLLLALAAPAARPGSAKAERIAEALGVPIPDAVRLVADLLGSPHAAVHAETAAWADLDVTTAAIVEWAGALPAGTTFDTRIPTPDEADAWASRATQGQIEKFPVDVDGALLVLASALALDVSWTTPLDVVPSGMLGADAPLAGRVRRVLSAARDGGLSVVRTAAAGDVALVVHRAVTDMLVATVAAAPEVPAADVLAVAHELATGAARQHPAAVVDPFDLALGEGPVITVAEREVPLPRDRMAVVHAYLPAWRADSTHDLMRQPGIPSGATAVMGLLAPTDGPLEVEAKQVATAEFSRFGFRAAAVSAMAMRASGAPVRRPGLLREVTLRFGHPHAVVAVALDDDGGPWHGVPVFSAWVGQATEVPED